MMRRGVLHLAGWLVLAAFVLSGPGCSPTTKSGDSTGGSTAKPTSTEKSKPPKQDPG